MEYAVGHVIVSDISWNWITELCAKLGFYSVIQFHKISIFIYMLTTSSIPP